MPRHRNELPDATVFFRLVFALGNRLRARMDGLLAEVDLTTQQAAVLTIVEMFAERGAKPPTQGELAMRLGSSHQNVRQVLDVLVRKRLVHVSPDPDDRRVRRIQSTPAVKKLFAARTAGDHTHVRGWVAVLDDAELRRANKTLQKALKALMEDDAAPKPARRVRRRSPGRAGGADRAS